MVSLLSQTAFFEAEPELESSQLQSNHFLDIDYFIARDCKLNTKATLALRGFPSQFNFVDYERRKIRTRGFCTDGHFGGASESEYCGLINFIDLEKIDTLDGLSGSPVFQFEKNTKGHSYLFAGVLIQATKQSGKGTFIYSSIVFRALLTLAAGSVR